MSMIFNVGSDVVTPLVSLWDGFVTSLPYVIGGLLVVAFGFLLGEILELVLIKILNKVKLNEFIHSLKVSRNLQKVDWSHMLGVLLKWYIFVVFLAPAASLAHLGELSVLLLDFARWLPSFMLAIVIVLLGWIGADIVSEKIESTKIESKNLVATIVRMVIIIFIFAVALEEIGVNISLLHQTFVIALASIGLGFSLAFGIGFGLAMKDEAQKVIKEVKKKM